MEDPRATIAREPMHFRQIVTVAIATGLNALDGFDVLSISFASPGIASSWGITRAALGVVLSMELIGMGVGAFALGTLADRWGRRPTILACLAVMATGMALASLATNIAMLSIFRLFTGLGIGGMLAAVSALVSECTNARRRNMAIAIMAGGYPLGAVIGGSIASLILSLTGRWQAVFELGAVITVAFVPLVLRYVPETIAFLLHKRPADALEKINRTMVKQGRAPLPHMPPPEPKQAKPGLGELFGADVRIVTLVLTLVYFGHMMSFYFFVKWIPKIVVDMGFPAAAAGGVLVWANVGGVLGALTVGLLSQRLDMRILAVAAMICTAVSIWMFGWWPKDLTQLSIVAACGGGFANAAISCLYATIAQSFPARLRGAGTGLVIGVGRAGAALGPIVGGLLFSMGWPLAWVAAVLACGTIVAGALLTILRRTPTTVD